MSKICRTFVAEIEFDKLCPKFYYTQLLRLYGHSCSTDVNENRAHVHVGKKDTQNFAKIWLEPNVELAKEGDLTDAQLKQLLKIVEENKEKLLKQWQVFTNGGNVRIIKINK